MRFGRHFRLRVLDRAVAYRNRRAHAGSLDDFTHAAARSGDAARHSPQLVTGVTGIRMMGQIPVKLGQSARFSPNRRSSSSSSCLLTPSISVVYTSRHVWRRTCTSSLWNGDRI
jgi:hypothetical protein